ncbi:MAG: TetR/AcrR family transcriptional regulator [Proteobacteria bacterium]|nr:TetR/AcrR family transcriptional regulator [Pseudomonadota bacterium]
MNRRSGIDSKSNILNAALKIFSEYGYRGASMRMIAHNAKISVGGLYIHFKNKEELCLTLMKKRLGDLSQELKKALEGVKNPVEAITLFITINLEYAKRHKELILTQSRERGFTFGLGLKRSFFKKQRTLIEEILKKGIDSGDFSECDVKETTKIIMGTLRGFVLSMVVDAYNLFTPEECSKLILYGLLRRNDKPANEKTNEFKSRS